MIKKVSLKREPEFMQELHKIRARLARKWNKMTPEEMVKSINESGRWLKEQSRSRAKRT